MSYRALLRRARNDNRLLAVMVELTYRCNLDCFICYNNLGLQGRPLTLEQYLRFFEDLSRMGTPDLTLTGGEPLAHPDFFTLGAAARRLGFVVRVKSNGHALRRTLAQRLKDEVDPFQIDISLHGATPEVHDRQTRVPGSFERLQGNLREMRDLGLRFQLRVPVTAWNEHQAEALCALADGLGVRIQFDTQITPRDNGDQAPLEVSPTPAGIERLYRLMQGRAALPGDPDTLKGVDPAKENEGGDKPAPVEKHCGAGSTSVTVDPLGNVYPCVQWRRPVGNLHQQGIEAIWTGSSELTKVRALSGEVNALIGGLGEQGRAMNFCPGLAEETTGSPLRLYPSVRLNLEILQRLANNTPPMAQGDER